MYLNYNLAYSNFKINNLKSFFYFEILINKIKYDIEIVLFI